MLGLGGKNRRQRHAGEEQPPRQMCKAETHFKPSGYFIGQPPSKMNSKQCRIVKLSNR
jgi:hypothetical protein